MNRAARTATIAAVTATILATAGCLSSAHRVPRSELARLAQEDPHRRAQRVRVIQGYAGDEGPPEAPRVRGGTTVIITGGGGGRSRPLPFRKSAKSRSEDSKVWIVLAALAAVGLAATEGARYDGWVKVHPMHPVHLYGPYGEYTWVPLAQLDPQTAAWARKAYIRDTEGPWEPVGRAPLNRVGFSYALLLGSGEIPSAREQAPGADSDPANAGFMSHIQLGVYPTQTLGVMLDFGLGWRDNAFGDSVFEARNAVELQFFPVAAGAIHAGLYGQIGVALRAEDGIRTSEKRSLVAGGGGLLQLEITTRLALMARLGYTRILGEDTAEATLGVAIY